MGKTDGQRPALALGLLILCAGAAGCAYDYPEPEQTTAGSVPVHDPAANPTPEATAAKAYSDLRVLEREAQNYAGLYRTLRAVPGQVILFDAGPLDGPVRGFGKTAKVASSGQYTVTAACVGAPGAKVAVGQEHPGAPFRPTEILLNCTAPISESIELQQGFVFAHLVLPGPGDTPWTGAVGGVRVTTAG